MPRLTGERPLRGATPDSILAVHAAGYAAVVDRLGPGVLLDIGCGEGDESVLLGAVDRPVVAIDRNRDAAASAKRQQAGASGPGTFGGLRVACMEAERLGMAGASVDWVVSSHLIEHFTDPAVHAAEMARVLRPAGTAFVLTPNEPADFENPHHLHLFRRQDLETLLGRYFDDVVVSGLDANEKVKADFARRRQKAERLLRLDVFDLRHRIPHSWYVGFYERALPLVYSVMARADVGGTTGISADDFFVTDDVDDTTPVLLATARRPRVRARAAT